MTSVNKYELITLTAGDCAENHAKMEQIGEKREEGQGFTVEELADIKANMETTLGLTCQLVNLCEALRGVETKCTEAAVLVIKNGVDGLLGYQNAKEDLFREQVGLEYDKKAFMYGRVVNKHARWNLCFDRESREADYPNKKGTIIGYDRVPLMRRLMKKYKRYFGEKARGLKVESNYYYDTRKTGIGFHGDSERVIVVACRIGYASVPIHFQWFLNSEPVGERVIVDLEPGDVYIMSESAVGTNWKKRSVPTLRHATGCDKFTRL
jgi:hypothetical protein